MLCQLSRTFLPLEKRYSSLVSSVLCVLAVGPCVQTPAGGEHLKHPYLGTQCCVNPPAACLHLVPSMGPLPRWGDSQAEQCWPSIGGSPAAGKIPALLHPREHELQGYTLIGTGGAFWEQEGWCCSLRAALRCLGCQASLPVFLRPRVDGFCFVSVLQNEPCSVQM